MKFIFLLYGLVFFKATFSQPEQGPTIYDRINQQLCKCLKESSETDSVKRKNYCYEFVLNANYEELKTYGVDTTKNKDFKKYYDLYLKRFGKVTGTANDKQSSGQHDNDDSFMGSLVRQTKLPNGLYNIILRSAELKMEQEFTGTAPIDEKELKRFISGEDNIIVSYQTIARDGKKVNKIKSVVYIGTEKK